MWGFAIFIFGMLSGLLAAMSYALFGNPGTRYHQVLVASALILRGRGDNLGAFRLYIAALELNPDDMFVPECICEMVEQGQYEENLVSHFTIWCAKWPANLRFRYCFAVVLDRCGDRAAAHEQWLYVIAHDRGGGWSDRARDAITNAA